MGTALGQTIGAGRRSGAGGALGTEQGARAAADGCTLTLATTNTLHTNPALNPKRSRTALACPAGSSRGLTGRGPW